MREKYLLLSIIAAYAILELWQLLPSDVVLHPFLFSNQEIMLQTYVWFACLKLAFMIIAFVLYQYSERYWRFFGTLFYFALAEFIEYFVNYNEPWFRILSIPVDVTSIRYTVLLIMLYNIWNKPTH